MIKCKNCGKDMPEELAGRFCPRCEDKFANAADIQQEMVKATFK